MAALNDNQKAQYLDAMGIQRWQLRHQAANELSNEIAEPLVAEAALPQLGWDALQNEVASCTDCELHCQRGNSVFGVGQ